MARCSSLFSFQREDSVIQLYSLITERRLGSSKSSLFSERRLAIRRFHSKSYLFSEERLGEKTPTSKPFQKTFQSAEEVRVLVCWCVGVWVGGVVGSGLGGFRNGTYTQEKSLKAWLNGISVHKSLNRGWTSADRSTKATLMLTVPCPI